MKREIKFRAWLPKLCKMIYIGSNRNDTAVWICEGGFNVVDHFTGSPVSLGTDEDGAELMQFTGLLDKNGREIYEGDIIKLFVDYGDETETEIAEIVYLDGSFGTPTDQISGAVDCEVIGNIYENSELLKA